MKQKLEVDSESLKDNLKIYEEMLDAMGEESIQMGVRIGKGIENNFLIILRFVPISTSLRFLSKSSIFPPIKC